MNNYITDVEASVRALLAQYQKSDAITTDTDIFAMGFVNSLFAMQLVTLVERQFGVQIASEDLDLANFRSIAAISAFVERKKAAA